MSRTAIRTELINILKTVYPIVNVKDWDIAGLLSFPDKFPIANVVTFGEVYSEKSLGKIDHDLRVVVDIIPWGNEENGMEACDEIFDSFPDLMYANSTVNGTCKDLKIVKSDLFALGTDVPAFKVQFELILQYRTNRTCAP